MLFQALRAVFLISIKQFRIAEQLPSLKSLTFSISFMPLFQKTTLCMDLLEGKTLRDICKSFLAKIAASKGKVTKVTELH